jgi:hypothetical protein
MMLYFIKGEKHTYFLLPFEKCYFAIAYNLFWMSMGVHDVFALVIIFFEIWLKTKACNSLLI